MKELARRKNLLNNKSKKKSSGDGFFFVFGKGRRGILWLEIGIRDCEQVGKVVFIKGMKATISVVRGKSSVHKGDENHIKHCEWEKWRSSRR